MLVALSVRKQVEEDSTQTHRGPSIGETTGIKMILKNSVGLVTGASRGLGKAFAEALLKKEAKVTQWCPAEAQCWHGKRSEDYRRGVGMP